MNLFEQQAKKDQAYWKDLAKTNMMNYISRSSLVQCKEILDALIERIASLEGHAFDLEESSDDIGFAISDQEDKEIVMCSSCNGSGLGQHEGSGNCISCKGTGAEQIEE